MAKKRRNPESISALDYKTVRKIVADNTDRLQLLGNWPPYIDKTKSVLGRLPTAEAPDAPGFDAGIACTLDMIPRNKQKLSAILHAAYTEEAVEQIRREAKNFDPDSETVWWLAACSICDEGGEGHPTNNRLDEATRTLRFYDQLKNFEKLMADPKVRETAARAEYEKMTHSFKLMAGVPFGIKDGAAQGAYIAGYDLAVVYSSHFNIFFVSTFRPTLGLETFQWSSRKDAQGRPTSGPVWGSKQFVKCSSFGELARVVKQASKTLAYSAPDFNIDDLLVNPMAQQTEDCWQCGETVKVSELYCARTGDPINECRCGKKECKAYCEDCFEIK